MRGNSDALPPRAACDPLRGRRQCAVNARLAQARREAQRAEADARRDAGASRHGAAAADRLMESFE